MTTLAGYESLNMCYCKIYKTCEIKEPVKSIDLGLTE